MSRFQTSRLRAGLLGAGLLVSAAGGASGCAGDRPGSVEPTPIRVLLIGDSITFGAMEPTGAQSFAEAVPAELGDRYHIENLGCGGSGAFNYRPHAAPAQCVGRAGELEALFDARVRPHTPADIAVVMLGTNDATLGSPPQSYRNNMQELLAGLVEAGVARVVILTPPRQRRPDTGLLLAAYRGAIIHPTGGLCARNANAICGPDVFSILDPKRDLAPDGIHVNVAGHRRIAYALVEFLRSLEASG